MSSNADPAPGQPLLITERAVAGRSTAHYVSDDQVLEAARRGVCRGLCGRTFLPSSLAQPVGRLCPACRHRYGVTVPGASRQAPATRLRRALGRPALRRLRRPTPRTT